MPSLKTSCLLVLVTCLFSLSISAPLQPLTDFKLGDNLELFLFRDDYRFFKFTLPELLPNYDLSIIANPYGDNDPELFLSTKQKNPTGPENSEYYSTSYGYSSIYIPANKLKTKTEYYLGVSCASDICGFNLTVDYALDFYMRPNVTDLIIDAQHGGTLVTRVYIPKNDKASHIVFAAEIENLRDIEQGIQMFANAGNEIPTSSKHDIVATQSWGDGKAAYIYKKDPKFCTDCNYTIVMEIPRGSKVTFSRTIYGDIIDIPLDSTRNDAIEANQTVTYAVDISKFNATQSLILAEITPYYGYPYIYAHIGSIPSKLEDYAFKAKAHSSELLEIPIKDKPSNGLLYITVFGKDHSTYTLTVWQNSKKMIFLPLGEPEIGQISGKGIQNYLVVTEGRKDMTMTFSVHPEQGKVDLFVKSCDDKSFCNFTVEETSKILDGTIPTSKKNPIIQYSNVPDGDEVVTFDMDGSSCSPNSNSGLPRCAFVVGVLSTDDKAARYVVTANRDGLHQPLRANQPVREHSQMDQYKYFYFTVSNDVGIMSVNFQVTKISGDVTVFISRKVRYPDTSSREDPLHYNDLYSFFAELNKEGLNGTYYISVKAETSATFSIVPIIEYDESASDISGHHLIRLSEGVPQKMVIDNTDAAYFKFEVAFFKGKGKGQHQNIEIALNEVQGNFEICATDSLAFPERGNCKYSSNSSTLLIPLEDSTFYGSFSYFVGVFPKASSNSSKAQSFSITWSASHNFRTLGFNTPFWNYASKNRSVFYKFEVHPNEDKEILIYKFTYSSSYNLTQIYLADQETKLGHDVTAFNYQRTTNGTGANANLIKLNQTDLQQLCRSTGSSVETKCYLYLAVTSTSNSDDYFTLLLSKDYYAELGITEGMHANFPFPLNNHPLKLYYYPHQIADITILAESWGRNITLFANIVRPKDYSSKKDWIYPTNKNFEFSSKSSASRQGESTLVIEAESLSDCGEFDKFRCGVAITLYHDASFLQLQKVSEGFASSTFSILATQDILPIGTGKPIHTYVSEGQYKYFRLNVNKDMATLLISGSIISGRDMMIFASKGGDARPTEHSYEFRGSLYSKIETLEITPEITKDGNTKGEWVIGVYGQTDTDFVLNVLFEKNKMIEMYQGLPVNAIASKEPVYFRYTQYGTASQMKITKERGSGIVSYKKYSKDAPLIDLPQKDSGFFKKFTDVQMILDFKSNNYWDADTYIIAIFPDESADMKVSAVIQNPDDFIYLVDNMIFSDYAANGIVNRYEHLAVSSDVIDINMIVYSGDPKIYVSHNPTVNATNKIWSSDKISSKNYIRMRLNNTPYNKNDAPLETIWNGRNNVTSFPDAYYIMVVSNTPSNYSIAVSVSNSTRHLIDGQMDFGFLNSGEKNVYKYHVAKPSTANKFSTLKLQFILHRDTFFDVNKEKIQKPDIMVFAVPKDRLESVTMDTKTGLPKLERVTPYNADVAERSYGDQNYIMNLQYRAISGSDFYIIVNNVQSKYHLNYSITANSHEPIYLAMNNIFSSRLDIYDNDVFAVHASHAGLLVIEIHECMGKVNVKTSRTRNFANAIVNPGAAASTLGSHIALSSIEISEEQTVYISVTGVEGSDNTALPSLDVIYKIKVNLFPLRNYLPFMNLSPGNDGLVEWDVTNGGKVQLSFNDLKNAVYTEKGMKSTKYGNLNIQYHYDVFLAKDPAVSDYLARCDMIPEDSYIFENMTKYSRVLSYDRSNMTLDSDYKPVKALEFEPEGDFDKLYANVRITAIGVDENNQHVWDYPVLYRQTEIRNIRQVTMNKFLVVLLGVCLIMLTLAIVGVMYYYRKFERVKQKLNYEMQDLRNLATTVESFDNYQDTLGDKAKGGYAGLVEEEP